MRAFLSQSINPIFEKILSLFLLFDWRAIVSNNQYGLELGLVTISRCQALQVKSV